MRVNDLRTPKVLFFACLAVFVALLYFSPEQPETHTLMSGVVVGLQETDGVVRAMAVESDGQRFVVRVSGDYLKQAPSPNIVEHQEVDLKVKSFRAVKRGVSCELVEVVKAGQVRPAPEQADGSGSAPKRGASLPVDDLQSTFGFKGM